MYISFFPDDQPVTFSLSFPFFKCKTWAQVIPRAVFSVFAADTHPLANLRVNVNSQMFDPLYDTFGVVEGDGMYLAPDKRIVMWGPNA